VVTHEQNQGLGCALRTGFRSAKGRIIVTMDADLTHPPELIGPMVEACTVDMVVASRYVRGGGMANVPWWRVWLSQMANGVFRLLFATRLRDITAGFKAYRVEILQDLDVAARGFEVQLEITVRLLKRGVSFRELPYVLKNRELGASKMCYLRLIPTYLTTLVELFRYRWNLGRTRYDQ
jgi:dolichol-phosphate mannosyltransferase